MNLLKEFRMIGDDDAWGSAMGAWFDTASELFLRGVDAPKHWEFKPGAGLSERDKDSFFWIECVQYATNEELIRFGNLMERYTRMLDKADKSY